MHSVRTLKAIFIFPTPSLSYFCKTKSPKNTAMSKLIKLTFLLIILLTAFQAQGAKSKYPKAMELRDLEKFVGIWGF
jgi:hypothetical protein